MRLRGDAKNLSITSKVSVMPYTGFITWRDLVAPGEVPIAL